MCMTLLRMQRLHLSSFRLARHKTFSYTDLFQTGHGLRWLFGLHITKYCHVIAVCKFLPAATLHDSWSVYSVGWRARPEWVILIIVIFFFVYLYLFWLLAATLKLNALVWHHGVIINFIRNRILCKSWMWKQGKHCHMKWHGILDSAHCLSHSIVANSSDLKVVTVLQFLVL